MTGYGSGDARTSVDDAPVRLVVDMRAVNHRFLDCRVRLPAPLAEHTAAVEALLRKRLRRGRVEVMARVEGRVERAPTLDEALARSAYQQLQALRDELAPGEPLPLSLLSSVPGLFTPGGPADGEALRESLLEATAEACDALDAMRLREGKALTQDLSTRLESIRAKLAQVRVLCPTVVAAQRQRLRERLEKLLADRDLELDQGRLEHEVALFAERTDVAEELARLTSHCDQFVELMQSTGPSHGRKLDFLLQEMAREVNTLGAKTPEVEVTRSVVELKADVERMREQVQNVL